MKAIIIGASGLIGNNLLHLLLADNYFEKIIALTRKPLPDNNDKLENILLDFNNLSELDNAVEEASVIFVAVGTTQKKVKGDKTAYRKVDYDIAINMANIGFRKKAKAYILVSSVGADPRAANFYTRLKGEIEQNISKIGIRSVYFMRPSMLLGYREEYRLTERIAQILFKPILSLLFGNATKFRAIQAKDVAIAMLHAAKIAEPGNHVWHYNDMMKLV